MSVLDRGPGTPPVPWRRCHLGVAAEGCLVAVGGHDAPAVGDLAARVLAGMTHVFAAVSAGSVASWVLSLSVSAYAVIMSEPAEPGLCSRTPPGRRRLSSRTRWMDSRSRRNCEAHRDARGRIAELVRDGRSDAMLVVHGVRRRRRRELERRRQVRSPSSWSPRRLPRTSRPPSRRRCSRPLIVSLPRFTPVYVNVASPFDVGRRPYPVLVVGFAPGDLELDGLADNRITLVVGERRRHRVIRPPEVLGRRRVEGQLEVDERRSRPAVDRRVRHEADHAGCRGRPPNPRTSSPWSKIDR